MHIGPEIGHQLLNSAERIRCLRAAEMPVITFAAQWPKMPYGVNNHNYQSCRLV